MDTTATMPFGIYERRYMQRDDDLVGYTFGAALHCPRCTMDRFPGADIEDDLRFVRDGWNPVTTALRCDVEDGDACDDCFALLG
jgi:hypothetical protein